MVTTSEGIWSPWAGDAPRRFARERLVDEPSMDRIGSQAIDLHEFSWLMPRRANRRAPRLRRCVEPRFPLGHPRHMRGLISQPRAAAQGARSWDLQRRNTREDTALERLRTLLARQEAGRRTSIEGRALDHGAFALSGGEIAEDVGVLSLGAQGDATRARTHAEALARDDDEPLTPGPVCVPSREVIVEARARSAGSVLLAFAGHTTARADEQVVRRRRCGHPVSILLAALARRGRFGRASCRGLQWAPQLSGPHCTCPFMLAACRSPARVSASTRTSTSRPRAPNRLKVA
jgi:hypothetical protein